MDSTSEQTLQPRASAGVNPMNLGFGLVAAFALGLGLGFFGRPAIINDVPVQVVVTVVPNSNPQAITEAPAPSEGPVTSAEEPAAGQSGRANDDAAAPANPTAPAEPTPTLMEFVMADARHIQGNADAPVTVIEFSDFK